MASSKHSVTVNSLNSSQENSLAEKITKNVIDAIGADQSKAADVTGKVTDDTLDIDKKV